MKSETTIIIIIINDGKWISGLRFGNKIDSRSKKTKLRGRSETNKKNDRKNENKKESGRPAVE